MTISDLPALNATLNFISTVFISLGWYFIRRGFWRRHIVFMVTAVCSSTAFLVGYLVYHAHVGEKSTHFTAPGIVRPIYFTMLISHILLAFVTLPLVIVTLVPVFRRRWDRHRRIATLDDADLALRFRHRRARLSHALQMVPAAESCTRPVVDV